MLEVLTIGHSTQTIEQFISLLARNEVSAIADVRSSPYSRHNPQFNREELRESLRSASIDYVFLGKELGARSDDECCYVDDKVSYELLAATDLFRSGLRRILEGAKSYRIALMCAERDPLDCHRTILVARELAKEGVSIQHILHSGTLESHESAIARLVQQLGIAQDDMFTSKESATNLAYEQQSQRIAYERIGIGATPRQVRSK